MISFINCIYKNKFAKISINFEGGIFNDIEIFEDNNFKIDNFKNKDNEDKEISNKIYPIDLFFSSNHHDLLKFDKENVFFNCNGMIALPGAIDPHVHFDTPGYDFRESFETGSASAIAGGVTTVIDMPCTSIPEVTNRKNFLKKLSVVKEMAHCDYSFFGGICGINIEKKDFENDINDLVELGVKGFKSYLISGMQSFPRLNNYQLLKAANICKNINKPLLLHAEDYDFINSYLSSIEVNNYVQKIKEKDKKNTKELIKDEIELYCESRSDIAELIAVQTAAAIAEESRAKIHIVHLSSAKAVRFIKFAREFCSISFETAPHYLEFIDEDFYRLGSLIKTAPPVKKDKDRIELRNAIIDGSCLFVASDHAASKLEEKKSGSFLTDYSGICGVQTIYQYMISEFLDKIPIERLMEITSTNAAKFYDLYPKKGTIEKGSDADLVFVKKDEKFIFNNYMLYSKMKESPYNGYEFKHRIDSVILRGKPAFKYDKGLLIKRGEGKFIY